MKSQKIVKFPFSEFTPSDYVVPCDGATQSLKTSTDVTQTGEDINSNGFNVTSRNVSRVGARRTRVERTVNGHGASGSDRGTTTDQGPTSGPDRGSTTGECLDGAGEFY